MAAAGSDQTSLLYPWDRLHEVAKSILIGAGTPADISDEVAGLLVWSERIGHHSHGLLRIPQYVERIRSGRLQPAARPEIVSETSTVAVLDGRWGYGQTAASAAAAIGAAKARSAGVSICGAYHINHIGRLGDFTEMCAREGLIAFLFVGGAPTGALGNVAPYGGRAPVWGTNPLAIAIPQGDDVFSLDFATSLIAGGKAAAAKARREQLDSDYLIDADGTLSRDPLALERGGAIRPFGEHKGYALAFAVELLAGALVGAMAPELESGELHNGLLLIVIDPGRLGPESTFRSAVASVVDKVKSTHPAEGFSEVLVPGEPEGRRLIESDRDGVRVPKDLVRDLNQLGAELGVPIHL